MTQLTIVGVGPGHPDLLTTGAQQVLDTVDEIWLRTRHHPIVDAFPSHLTVHSFDALYETSDDFDSLYRQLADEVLRLATQLHGVVYGVPGSPWVGETTVRYICEKARDRDLDVHMVHGLSFLEPTAAALGFDVLDGVQIVDATDLAGRYFPAFEPDRHTLIAQVYDRLTASAVKLVLLELFPSEYEVMRVSAAGMSDEQVTTLPLYQLDHADVEWGLLSSLYVPPIDAPASMTAFMSIIAHLRSPDGCPWDREQDHRSLRPFLLEETYEVLAALDAGDADALHEELGDLLLQIALHAQIASEYHEFTIADVIGTVSEKMIRRHPHVFGDVEVKDASEVLHNWETLKREEKAEAGDVAESAADEVPTVMPALLRAQKHVRRAQKQGWNATSLDQSISSWQTEPSPETLGSLLVAIAASANEAGVDAESALREAVTKLQYG